MRYALNTSDRRGRSALKKLIVQDTLVSLTRINDDDYISLTDIARVRNPDEPKDVVKNWLRNRATVEYLGCGKRSITPHLKGSNSTPLEFKLVQIASPCRPINGSRLRAQLASKVLLGAAVAPMRKQLHHCLALFAYILYNDAMRFRSV
jgi:hypothetical protein